MLIALSAKSLGGKTTAANYLVNQHGFTRISFAHALKLKVMADFDFTRSQVFDDAKDVVDPRYGVAPREILIGVGNLYRTYDKDYWVKRALKNVTSDQDVVIDDLRFINEAEHISSLGGKLVRLERAGAGAKSAKAAKDQSETEMDTYTFDHLICSTSVEDMQLLLNEVLTKFHKDSTLDSSGRGVGDINVI